MIISKIIRTIYRRELCGLGMNMYFPTIGYGPYICISVDNNTSCVFDVYEAHEYKNFMGKYFICY